VAEGDTILRTAKRLDAALGGRRVSARAPNPRGRAARVERLDGRVLQGVEARGKHLLLGFEDDLVLHSHLAMSGTWQVKSRGARWRRSPQSAWLILAAGDAQAAQFGGPTLRLLDAGRLRRDPTIGRLGPDILAGDFSPQREAESLRRAAGDRAELGEVLLDQRLIAGIGNIFKSEGCFAAAISPWRRLADLDDEQLARVIESTRELMVAAVHSGRQPRRVYRRAGQACTRCGNALRSRGQGDANRTAYWCPDCQRGPEPAKS
jgi:endonuclease VIII